ncbi:MAG: hypothetical protein ACE5ES_05815 [Candidatus Nanoarchaeia archaeon]
MAEKDFSYFILLEIFGELEILWLAINPQFRIYIGLKRSCDQREQFGWSRGATAPQGGTL